jgi:hypothetical protein
VVTGAVNLGGSTTEDWAERISGINTQVTAEASARFTLQGVAAGWDASLRQVFDITRHAVVLSRKRFQNEPAKLALFASFKPSDSRRALIAKVGAELSQAWEKADAAWVPVDGATLPGLKALLRQCDAAEVDHAEKLARWRTSTAALNAAAEALHDDNVAWYAAAIRQFPESSPFGEMIRATVPVTTEATEQVGQAVIQNLRVAGGTVRFDCEAPHATNYTYLHQRPGETVWSVLQANTPETSVTLGGLTPGEHHFKAFGANAQDIGPESAEMVAAIAQANAA